MALLQFMVFLFFVRKAFSASNFFLGWCQDAGTIQYYSQGCCIVNNGSPEGGNYSQGTHKHGSRVHSNGGHEILMNQIHSPPA